MFAFMIKSFNIVICYLHDRILSELLALTFCVFVVPQSFSEAMAPKGRAPKAAPTSRAAKDEVKAAADLANQVRIDQTSFLAQTGGANATPDQKAANQLYKYMNPILHECCNCNVSLQCFCYNAISYLWKVDADPGSSQA